jgi:hypothetical protein
MAKILLPFYRLSLESDDCFLCYAEVLQFDAVLFDHSPGCWDFWVLFRNSFPIAVSSTVLTTASWSCFNDSGLIWRCVIHFVLILVKCQRQGYSFSVLHVDIQFSRKHLFNRQSFLHWVFWNSFSNISWL